MEEIKPTANVTLPVTSLMITVTHVITQTGQTEPSVEVIETAGGQVKLTVSESPIFIEDTQAQPGQPQGRIYLPLVLKSSGGN